MYAIKMESGRLLKHEFSGALALFDTKQAALNYLESFNRKCRFPTNWNPVPLPHAGN